MRTHRQLKRGLFGAAGLAGLAALAWSCAFPEVQFSDGILDISGEGGGGTEGGAETGTRPSDVDGARPDANVADSPPLLIDGSTPDALIVKDAGAAVDASGCTAARCDCDGDGFNDFTKAACATGTRDCDDLDTRARPGQLFLEDPPTAKTGGDWNCSGTVEKLYAENVSCGALLGLGCNTGGGFQGTVACGQTGTFIRCKSSLLSCVVGESYQAKQACR